MAEFVRFLIDIKREIWGAAERSAERPQQKWKRTQSLFLVSEMGFKDISGTKDSMEIGRGTCSIFR